MSHNYFIFIAFVAVFYGGHVSAQDSAVGLVKCDTSDGPCMMEFIKTLALVYGAKGFPADNISSIEPTYLEKTSTNPLDILTLTLHAGEALNITHTCRHTSYEMDMTNFRRKVGMNCKNIVIQGIYTVTTNPHFTNIAGDITGKGNLTIVLNDWYFYFDNQFHFYEKENEIYMKVNFNEGGFETKVNSGATFKADSIKRNNRDITKKVLKYMNKNWEAVLDTFGADLYRLSALDYYDIYGKLFDNMPATEMFTNDLTQYPITKN